MGIPLRQVAKVGAYIVGQHLAGRKRYPLVLMLEPLFRCNLACAGCGKIDYPDAILDKRISVEDALASVDECGAPVVVMAGGEPLLHKELPKIVEGVIARRSSRSCAPTRFCSKRRWISTRRALISPGRSISTATGRCMTSRSARTGVYDRAVAALKRPRPGVSGSQSIAPSSMTPDAARIADFF